jgi:UDP-hydrolysing UDP-N-acetyl-D-glucosamine 2-epimerase
MSSRRSLAIVSVARSDFGLYAPLLELVRGRADLELRLMPTAAHYDPTFGLTIREIEAQGYDFERGLELPAQAPTAEGMSRTVAAGVSVFAEAFARRRPDFLVVLGDRAEMLCAPVAALPYNIPVAHIHGGKVTEGALDERVRHAITKVSHLHFVSCPQYARRVLQLGEEAWRVADVGAMGLAQLRRYTPSSKEAVYAALGLDAGRPFLIVTYHPVTLEAASTEHHVQHLLQALDRQSAHQIVLTYPNADVGHTTVIEHFQRFQAAHPERVRLLKNAGSQLYMDMMTWAAAMVGNSSSGIVEAPSFELPVVNIGTRQAGAVRGGNVIDCGYDAAEITVALERALSAGFRASLKGLKNPYGDGRAAERIVETLASIAIDDRLLRKKFIDWPVP